MDVQTMTLKLPQTEVNWPHFHLNEYISYFASLVVKSRGLLRRTDEGALLACMGNDMWNSILFESLDLSKELNLIDVVARWGQFFASNGVDHYDAYFLSTIPKKNIIEDALKANKFRFWASIYGMELDLTSYNPTPNLNFPSDFEIELIPLNSDEKMSEMHTIAATNFLEPQEQDYRPTLISMRRSALEEPYYQYYVGKYQGKAVATISISLKHAFAGISQISDVTTLEAHRGKGYASVLIQFALAECKKLGFKWAVLQGERDGPMKLYKRLGFVTSCEIDVWEKPSDEGETSEAQSN